jgi:hypothetical protein
MGNYYQILKVSEQATTEEIKQSYRLLAKKYHPDSSGTHDTSQRFHEIQKAYKTLTNPAKRRHYDKGLEHIRSKRIKTGASPRPSSTESYQDNALLRWKRYVVQLREDEHYFQRFRKYHKAVVYSSFFLIVMFFTDFWSATNMERENVLSTQYLYALTKVDQDAEYALITTDRNIYRLHLSLAATLQVDDELMINQSYFFSIVNQIQVVRTDAQFIIKNDKLSTGFGFFTFLLLVTIVTSLANKKSEQMVNATLICSLVLILNFLILLGLIF